MQTVTAYPVVLDVPALNAFLSDVFGAVEKMRVIGSAGGYHTEVLIGDAGLFVGGGGPDVQWKGEARPMAFHLYVPDVDATYAKALEAGASSLEAPAEHPWGERSGNIKDPAGNYWYIATFHGKDYFREGLPTLQPYLHPVRCGPLMDFVVQAFGGVETGRSTAPDGTIFHGTVRIGTSSLEFCDAMGPYQPMPGMFYVLVDDADAAYGRALACGAESVASPADQSYGHRTGAVRDSAGNSWYLASIPAK